ncbi:MAG: multicomponent Na+:H+ antiporter subunit F [Hydrogenophaga sp.]|jgi:multicomponent Na+:H+ antiporter subunit F
MIVWATTALVIASLLALALASVRLVRGPTDADRIVALDIFLAAGVALAVAASLLTERTVFLDVAIGLALVGFVGTIGWARLVEQARPVDKQKERR